MGAGYSPGQSAEPGGQFGLVCFLLGRGEFGGGGASRPGWASKSANNALLPCTRDQDHILLPLNPEKIS